MLEQFFVVTINCGARKAPNGAVELALSGYDWLRFSRESYYVHAYVAGPNEIYNMLKPILHSDDLILVVQVLPDTRMGWTSKIAVDWFEKFRT